MIDTGKMKKLVLLTISVWLAFSGCENMENIPGNGPEQEGNLSFDTRSVSQELMDHSRLFLFDGDNRNNAIGQYNREIIGISRNANILSAQVEAGKWNIGMVSCETNPLTQLKTPVRGTALKDNLMWETVPVAGSLPDTPEILTEVIEGINILPDINNQATANYRRHVAKIEILLKDGVGFKTGGGHYVYLKNVPTSISWGKSLYPNKDNPYHSGEIRMTKELTFQDAGSGHQKSEAASFIIPAHISTSATDLTTHKLKLGVIFKTVGGTTYEKHDVVINEAPRDNSILRVNLTAKGGVEVKTEIVDWELESSTIIPEFYNMVSNGYNAASQEWTFTMTMNQERNWHVRLGGANPNYFEFVNATASSGQAGITAIRIRRSSSHPGGTYSATLSLYVSGYNQVVQSWNIND